MNDEQNKTLIKSVINQDIKTFQDTFTKIVDQKIVERMTDVRNQAIESCGFVKKQD